MSKYNDSINEAIINGTIEQLNEMLQDGWDINEKVGKYYQLPINVAIDYKRYDVVKWLVDHHAELNDSEYPAVLYAARSQNTDLIGYIVKNGGNINVVGRKGRTALVEAMVSKKQENIEAVINHGFDMPQLGGGSLRRACWKGELDLVKLFTENGADVNYHSYDQVHTDEATPLQVAIEGGHTEVVKYLLENGADVTIPDKYGMTPLKVVKKFKNNEIKELLNKYEPIESQGEVNQKHRLRKLGLPTEVIDYLGTQNKTIELSEKSQTRYIKLATIFEVTDFFFDGIQVIDLIIENEAYDSTGLLVYIPAQQCFGSVDLEHHELIIIGVSWKKFLYNPEQYIDGILLGQFS